RNLPRVGITMQLNSAFEQFDYFGRGPFENYRDRNAGSLVALHESTVTDQFVNYIMPQANGNKTDVRKLWLKDGAGKGLEVSAINGSNQGVMEVTASHYTEADIYQAMHTNELNPIGDVVLNLDHIHAAIGGASCGPATLEEYHIKPGSYKFGFVFRPV
ncbi:MAG: beta-galactosidase small subunit, partial [Chloroflexota bacterium]